MDDQAIIGQMVRDMERQHFVNRMMEWIGDDRKRFLAVMLVTAKHLRTSKTDDNTPTE